MDNKYITFSEAVIIAQKTPQTIRNWMAQRKFEFYKNDRNRLRISKQSLLEYIEQGKS